jgi:polysaccharide deacetylase family protein (PEP-CTERM system associated)
MTRGADRGRAADTDGAAPPPWAGNGERGDAEGGEPARWDPRAVVNALTIDVEDYFHPNAMDATVSPTTWDALPHRVEANTRRMLDLLDECAVRATFFVLGWVAERWPHLVSEIAARGHEVACHGHAHRLAYRLGPEGFRADVERAKRVLEDRLGAAVDGFRAASYSIVPSTLWAFDILIEQGFRYDSSVFPIHHDLYGFPGFSRFAVRVQRPAGEIVEIPASTVRLFGRNWPVAGGGYFRLLPLALTCRAIRHINTRAGAPAIVYLHPWEIDVDQPRLPAGVRSRLRQYTNLQRTEPRARQLLRRFRFAPVRQALSWLAPPVFDVEAAALAAGAAAR